MAAPSGTSWGAVSGSSTKQGRIGLYISLSNTNTTTNVTIEVWFWSRVSVDDSNNSFYFDNEKSSATTSRGSVSVRTTSNNSWNTANQVKIKTYTYSYTRGTSASTKTCAAKLTGIEWATGTMTVSKSYTIPALASYKITYNANGGSGAPGQQTKYYGKTLKLSTTKPTRTGYTFQGWGTSATGSVVYDPGDNYTANAADTLYAIWKANTWTVKYDANGGTGAPGNQTKTYGVTLKLSTTIPTLTNYNFLGWGTSPDSTTVAYQAGADYTNNAAVTLYAIWELAYVKPRVTNLTADRCTSAGVLDDDGTYIKVAFDWATDKTISAADSYIQWLCSELNGSVERHYLDTLTGTSGSVSVVVGSNAIDTEYAWDITVYIKDEIDDETFRIILPSSYYMMDFKDGGTGVSIGETATYDGFAVNMDAIFRKSFATPWIKTNTNGIPSFTNHVGLNNGYWLQAALAGNSNFVNLLRMNEDGQVEMNWTSGGLKGRVFKKLWEGTCNLNGQITVPELPYYSIFLVYSTAAYAPAIFGLFTNDRKYIMLFSAISTAGESYQNAYLYAGMFSVKSSTTIALASLSCSKLYPAGTELDKSLAVVKILGVL